MQKIIIGKTYRHFKGNLYRVMALGKNSENMEEMVVDDKGTLRFTLVE